MLTISEVQPGDVAARIPSALADVAHDAADPSWVCVPSSTIVLPTVDELQRVAAEGVEHIVLLEDAGTIVGLTTVADDGRMRWLILDTTQFAALLEPLGDWIVQYLGVNPWGVVSGDNQRLAAMIAHPRVLIEEQIDNAGNLATVVRWQ